MPTFIQSKKTVEGSVKTWEIDTDEIRKCISWAGKKPDLLLHEIQEMNSYYPHFYVALFSAKRLSRREFFCPRCGDIITFDRGVRCVNCETVYNPPSDSLIGYIGRIPHWIGIIDGNGQLGDRRSRVHGHPYLKHIHSKLQSMNEVERRKFHKYFLAMRENNTIKVYFAPPIYAIHPSNWPRSKPDIYVERDYFDVMLFNSTNHGTNAFHAYTGGSHGLLHLCNYSSWRSVTMRKAIEQRIVPKIMIDTMIADLIAVDKLDAVVRSLGTTVHGVYNFIGKSGRTERFKREFDRHVQIDC